PRSRTASRRDRVDGNAGVRDAARGRRDAESSRRLMSARLAAHFAKLWSAVAIEPPLWEGGGRRLREDGASITRCVPSRFHRPPKAVALPPHSKVLRTKTMSGS